MINVGDIRRMKDGSIYFVTYDRHKNIIGMWFHLIPSNEPPSEDDEYLGNLAKALATFRERLDEHK